MSHHHLPPIPLDHAADAYRGDEVPDLGPLRALAEREELAEAVARVTDEYGRPLPHDDPLAPLARQVACALTEAGLAVHHCCPDHPLYRLGGVCLLPVARSHDPNGKGGVVVSWTTHELLAKDWDRWNESHDARTR